MTATLMDGKALAERIREDVAREVADVVHEEAHDPVLALPCELGLTGPVASQPDLDVPGRVDVPVSNQSVHGRPV